MIDLVLPFVVDPILLSFIAGLLLLALYLLGQRKPKNFPPGPWGFPLFGHLPLLGLQPFKTVMAWKPKYGPIVGIDFGSFPCVIISDYKLAKEALANPAFAGRPKLSILSSRSGGEPKGIVATSGRVWREQRTFAHRRLKELSGFGTRSMEAHILTELQDLVAELRTDSDGGRCPVSMQRRFNIPMLSVLWKILAGERLSRHDANVRRVLHLTLEAVEEHNFATMLSMFMPWLANYFPVWISGADAMENIFLAALELIQPYVDKHYNSHVPRQPGDFMDAYIDEIQATTDPESSFHESRSENLLATTISDFYLGGVDTAGITMEWICLLVASYPGIQERAAAEIKAVVGSNRQPSIEDRKSLHYTEALVNEVMRFRPVLALGLFHATTEDVWFQGYNIPKDTMVFVNVWDAHFSQEIWGNDVGEFRPERWLNLDGTEFVRREGFLLFLSGKRSCLGEQLARDELFLFTVGILQTFCIGLDPTMPPPTLDPKAGGSNLALHPHKLVLSPRN